MKRVGVLLAALLMLVGCGKAQQQEDYSEKVQETLRQNYRFTATFKYEEIEGEALIEKTAEDHLVASISKPATMEGMVITLSGEDVSLAYHTMEIDLSGYQLPTESIVSVLRQILAGEGISSVTEESGIVTATGDYVLFHYNVTFDAATMTPLTISVPELAIEVTITDFTPLEATQAM